MEEFIHVANTSDIPQGQCKTVKVNEKNIALFNVDGEFYAMENACKHMGGPLGEGVLNGNIVTCPWHGWQYDVTSGESTLDPSIKMECYQVKTDGDKILVSTNKNE